MGRTIFHCCSLLLTKIVPRQRCRSNRHDYYNSRFYNLSAFLVNICLFLWEWQSIFTGISPHVQQGAPRVLSKTPFYFTLILKTFSYKTDQMFPLENKSHVVNSTVKGLNLCHDLSLIRLPELDVKTIFLKDKDRWDAPKRITVINIYYACCRRPPSRKQDGLQRS